MKSRTFGNPQPLVFSQKYCWYKWKAYCGTNRRRTAVQVGGVLRRFPFLQSLEASKAQRYKWGAKTSCTGWGLPTSGGVSVQLGVRFQAVNESTDFRWIPTWEPNWEGNRLKAFLKVNVFVRVLFGELPSAVAEFVRVRFCCLLS